VIQSYTVRRHGTPLLCYIIKVPLVKGTAPQTLGSSPKAPGAPTSPLHPGMGPKTEPNKATSVLNTSYKVQSILYLYKQLQIKLQSNL
jgi:hypothetical protein